MKYYVMTYGHDVPRIFNDRMTCSFAVKELLERDGENEYYSLRSIDWKIYSTFRDTDEEAALFVIDWACDLVIRVYKVELEREF